VPEWLKIITMIIFLGGYVGVVGFMLVKGSLPDAAMLGLPAIVVAALWPPGILRGRRGQQPEVEAESETAR
jgi:hypothetical protein